MDHLRTASGGPPLGKYGTSSTLPGQGLAARASRHQLKAVQREVTESVSSRLCGYPVGSDRVEVAIGREWVAHVGNVSHCGSPWNCSTCAPVIRMRRSLEVGQAVAYWQDLGHSVIFPTLTLPHAFGDPLGPRLSLICRALGACHNGKGWNVRRDALGYVGSVRAPEITDGPNGWHAHLHALLFVEGSVEAAALESYRVWLYERWTGVVQAAGFGTINRHGLDVKVTGRDSGRLGEYLQAVEGGWSMGAELTQAASKRSKTAVDSLRLFSQTGDMSGRARWLEWEGATAGKSSLRFSQGLRAKVLPEVEEVDDVEAASAEGLGRWLVRAWIEGEDWIRMLKSGESGEALRELVEVAFVLVLMCDIAGCVPVESEG